MKKIVLLLPLLLCGCTYDWKGLAPDAIKVKPSVEWQVQNHKDTVHKPKVEVEMNWSVK